LTVIFLNLSMLRFSTERSPLLIFSRQHLNSSLWIAAYG